VQRGQKGGERRVVRQISEIAQEVEVERFQAPAAKKA
jgi:hypothetical protein